jgi:di/tricarboxylate transporter
MTFAEKLTLSTVAVSLIGFATQRWHGIDEAWVAMLCFFILFASTVLDDQSLKEMDWSFLISYGAMTGFASLTQTTGLADVIVETIKPSLHLVSWHPVPLLLTTCIAVHLLRFLLPQTPALLVTMLAITPLVASEGVNPFIVGLVALISSNPWILQHQNSIYRNIWKATGGKLFKHEKTTSYAILHIAIVLVAVLVSIPVWYHLGLLR